MSGTWHLVKAEGDLMPVITNALRRIENQMGDTVGAGKERVPTLGKA